MKIILLPGMDGTGILFEPLLKELSEDMDAQVISYPFDMKQSYSQLTCYVKGKLPESEEFVLVAESFSGPIGYAIATQPPENLRAVVFVSTFINPPNRFLWAVIRLPLTLLFKLPVPVFVIKGFFLGKGIENHTVSLFRKSLKNIKSNILAYRVKEMARLKGGSKKIRVPCAYIAAGNDRLVSRSHVEAFRYLAPEIEVAEIPGPHFILQAKPKECALVINKYVAI